MAGADVQELSRMTVGDAVNYVLFDNPFSKVFVQALSGEGAGKLQGTVPVLTTRDTNSHMSCPDVLTRILGPGGNWSRLAGFSGLLAVGFGIYGGYAFPRTRELIPDKRNAYDTAARHHLFHSVALLSMPLCSSPTVTGHLMALGIVLFCGSGYVYALNDSELARKITPYGGILLLLAWASMML